MSAKTFGQEPPSRYWIGVDEHARRTRVINERLDAAGIHDMGHRHDIVFT